MSEKEGRKHFSFLQMGERVEGKLKTWSKEMMNLIESAAHLQRGSGTWVVPRDFPALHVLREPAV